MDNHDLKERFNHPFAPQLQVTLGWACLFCLQGIPAMYYGTEQGLQGTVNPDGSPDLSSNESTREALWGKSPTPFDTQLPLFRQLQALAALRASEPALRSGRLYFREVSGNGRDFGHSSGTGGVIAFSRILSDGEITVVGNCNTQQRFEGLVLQDPDLNRQPRNMAVAFSNLDTQGAGQVQLLPQARFFSGGALTGTAEAAALFVGLEPMEVQILRPQ
jgi:glycosidase